MIEHIFNPVWEWYSLLSSMPNACVCVWPFIYFYLLLSVTNTGFILCIFVFNFLHIECKYHVTNTKQDVWSVWLEGCIHLCMLLRGLVGVLHTLTDTVCLLVRPIMSPVYMSLRVMRYHLDFGICTLFLFGDYFPISRTVDSRIQAHMLVTDMTGHSILNRIVVIGRKVLSIRFQHVHHPPYSRCAEFDLYEMTETT